MEEKHEKRIASDEESSLQDRSDKDARISVSEDSSSTIQIKEKVRRARFGEISFD